MAQYFLMAAILMIQIDDVLVDNDILDSNFACDLAECKGACCTFPGEYGAPLKEEEIEKIAENLEAAKKYLSEKSKRIIDKYGYYERKDRNLTTKCIDGKDCVFVYYDGDVAKCSIEKAYHNKESNFRKPVSCHLFPLRVGNFGGKHLYYEKIKECKPGRKLGDKKGIYLTDTVKDALIREFGEDWTEKFIENL